MKINPIATWKAWRREGLLAQTCKKYKRNQDKRKRCNDQCNLFLNETQWRSEALAVSYLNSAFKDGTEVPGPFPLAACSALHRPLSFSPGPQHRHSRAGGPWAPGTSTGLGWHWRQQRDSRRTAQAGRGRRGLCDTKDSTGGGCPTTSASLLSYSRRGNQKHKRFNVFTSWTLNLPQRL